VLNPSKNSPKSSHLSLVFIQLVAPFSFYNKNSKSLQLFPLSFLACNRKKK
jgi:hypothetical protein